LQRKRDSVERKRETPNLGATDDPREVETPNLGATDNPRVDSRYVSVSISVERKRNCPYQAGRALERFHAGDSKECKRDSCYGSVRNSMDMGMDYPCGTAHSDHSPISVGS
jgi:hypothetical protein